jgi:hypothetical protein
MDQGDGSRDLFWEITGDGSSNAPGTVPSARVDAPGTVPFARTG